MRTTVRLPDELLEAAKRRAVETGRTLTEVIEDALRASLAREDVSPTPGRDPFIETEVDVTFASTEDQVVPTVVSLSPNG